MKKISFVTIAAMLIAFNCTHAQKCLPENIQVKTITTTLVQAPDFTITTTDGVQRNLYATLNNNKSVVLDFFFVGCTYCQQYAPTIDQAYIRYGSGNGNIEFWGISDRDNNAAINQYRTTYGVTNPCAGTAGNGASVSTTFENSFAWSGWPTYSVVCKNKTINWDINYPPSATGFDSFLSTCGNSWGVEEYDPEKASIQGVYPSPAYNTLNVAFYLPRQSEASFEFFDLQGAKIASYQINEGRGLHTFELAVGNLADGHYFFTYNVNGKRESIQKFVVLK